ncbi:Tripartite-type tricarboxylate transporter, receptor component TctC [Variovorax sp. HW608]|uniref:Bug family tripartite tricarboxylate transporter substrate binding protein n=1 Tax=Variovorax sp. HW608 TaxID=1034889 RepID=UPI00081FD214|nr:tripartite tricarboxylate transporter substrate binding protein [Variovorax sp. HW608]SCK21607.1 Tripartite-type tricarboxylate transporter, receptor component TctC [Variovorax sp. HW608]
MNPSITRRGAVLGGLSCLIGAAAFPAQAAAYPERPVRLLIGFPPAGGADFVGRLVAQRMSQTLGGNVIVENKAGANGMIAAADVARSQADGYTLLLGVTASQSISPVLVTKPLYDPLRDFTPISMVGFTPLVLVVNPKLPVRSVGEFIGYVKESKEPVPYGSAGIGNITHMAAELFVQTTGASQLRHIPYKGSGQVITDLIGGQVQAYFDTLPSSLPFIQSGQLRALAVTGQARSAAAPDIPTMQEAGLADYSPTTWFGVLAPPRLDSAIAQQLNAALEQGFSDAESRKGLTVRGVEPVLNSPAEFRAELEADLSRWRGVTRKAGITLE